MPLEVESTLTAQTLAFLKEAMALLEDPDGGEYELREFLKSHSLYVVHDYEAKGDRPIGTIDCGSVALEDTPACLYRALFLFRPEWVSFKDMYKNSLLTLVSPDYRLVASIDFFKYEMGVYFSASKEHTTISSTANCGIISGMPGADNGVKFQGELAEQWFGFLVKLLTRKWMVYSGNNFEV